MHSGCGQDKQTCSQDYWIFLIDYYTALFSITSSSNTIGHLQKEVVHTKYSNLTANWAPSNSLSLSHC